MLTDPEGGSKIEKVMKRIRVSHTKTHKYPRVPFKDYPEGNTYPDSVKIGIIPIIIEYEAICWNGNGSWDTANDENFFNLGKENCKNKLGPNLASQVFPLSK